jgi:hypothetical protein
MKGNSMKNTNRFSTYTNNTVLVELTDEDLENVTGGNGMQDFNDYDRHDHDHDHDRHDRYRHDRHRRGYRY